MCVGNCASASRRYAAIDTGSKVEGANPHQRVKILFDELLLAIGSSIVADKAGDRSKCSEKQARALSILHALESSLDFDKGGQVALGLAQIYREARRLIVSGLQTRSAEEMHQARHIINEIAEAEEHTSELQSLMRISYAVFCLK